MKKVFLVAILMLVVVSVGLSFAASRGKMDLKVGQEIYACNCGEKCPCDGLSNNPGKCGCGKDMVKATVSKVEEGKATLKAAGWEKERSFKTVGKFTCACPPECKCDTISQSAGKCTCGKDMKAL